MKKYITPLIFCFFLIPLILPAQYGGRYFYEFLNPTSYSPRVAAMGGDFLAVKDGDIGLALSNPSTITEEMDNHLTLNYTNYYDGINYGYASYGKTTRFGNFVASGQFMSYGTFDRYTEAGELAGQFYASDVAINLGWGRPLSEKFSMGANVKLISSFYESYSSFGVGVDIGGTYHNPEKNFTSSLVVKNIGRPIVTYAGESGPLPFEIQLGMSKRLEHLPFRYSILLNNLEKYDLRYDDPDEFRYDPLTGQIIEQSELVKVVDNVARHVVIGGEFMIHKNFSLRAGYNYKRRQELKVNTRTAMVGFSWGFGFRVKKFHFNFARSTYHLAGSPNYISITMNLSEFYTNKVVEE